MSNTLSFDSLGLTEEICHVLKEKGYLTPTLVQQKVVPEVLQTQRDLIVQSATGSGKTGAFGMPLVQLLQESEPGVHALVLAPTRELAIQVSEELLAFQAKKSVRVVLVCGGQPIVNQIRQLKKQTHPTIVVGTPGRVNDLLRKGVLKIDDMQFLVLDEVDEMLDMGFKEEVDLILSYSHGNPRSIVVSATLPKPIQRLLGNYLTDPLTIDATSKDSGSHDGIEQSYFLLQTRDKQSLLFRLIDQDPKFYGVVFCATKRETELVSKALIGANYQADFLHGDLNQAQRESVLRRFKSRQLQLLVVTDVAARGIDIKDVTYVVNYDLPQSGEIYVHRIGRTGRAGKKGQSVTFVKPSESFRFEGIQRKMGDAIQKGVVPRVEDILDAKQDRLIVNLAGIEPTSDAAAMANALLKDADPDAIIAKLLTLGFSDVFDEKKYPDVTQLKPRARQGRSRDDRNQKGRYYKRSNRNYGRKRGKR